MNPLEKNHSVLKFIGACDVDEATPKILKLKNQFSFSLLVIMHIINITATSLYFLLYMSIDYNGGIYGLLAATVLSCNLHTLVTLRLHSKEIRMVFSTFRTLRQKSTPPTNQSNGKLRKIQFFSRNISDLNSEAFKSNSYAYQVGSRITKIFITIYAPLYFGMILFIGVAKLTNCYLQGQLSEEHPTCLDIPYRYVLPWDQTTLFGYFSTYIYLILFSAAYFLLNSIFLSAFVVITVQFDSLRVHFENILFELKTINEKDFNSTMKIKKVLCNAIRFHILMRE